MKKIFSFLAVAVLALGFTACEDVPAPYSIEDEILGDGAKTLPYIQSFEASLGGYKSYTVSGEGRWINDHKAAVASGYNSATQTTTAGCFMLVSPEISLADQENAHILCEYTLRYLQRAEDQKIMITKNFDESQPGAGWTEIPVKLEEVNDWSITKMADLQIPEDFMGGKVRIAFYYNTNNVRGASWQLKNVSVLKGMAEGGEDKPVAEVKELPYEETFAESLGLFSNYTTAGAGEWKFDSRGFAKGSGFTAPDQPAVKGTYYLVSPEISLQGKTEAHFSYEYINSFNENPLNHQFMINPAFDENKPEEGWVALKADHENTTSWTDWKKADVQIPAAYMGKNVRIAFRYSCDSEKASTFEVKNFQAAEGKASGGNEPVNPEGDVLFSAPLTSGMDGCANYLGTAEWKWEFDEKFGCMKVSGHVGGKEGHKVAGVAYFVTPEISLEKVTEAHVSYASAIGYMSVPENHQLVINANFDEANPEAGWVVMKGQHEAGEKFFTWMNCDVQIPAEMMGKKVRIGFRYECDAEKASTWEIKEMKVLAGKAEEGGNEGGSEGDLNAANGNFEAWDGSLPNNWKTDCSAGNAKLSQSTDAHSGKYAVKVAGDAKANKRLAYKEMTLEAGTYTMRFYAKAATATGGSVRPGYAVVTGGSLGGDSYKYGDYTNGLKDQWVEVVHEFTLEEKGTYCMVIMNAKKPGGDVLVDDFTLTDASGKVLIK